MGAKNYIYDENIFNLAVSDGIIPYDQVKDVKKAFMDGDKDIDQIVGQPVRLMLCIKGLAEWRNTMLWRNLFYDGIVYKEPLMMTLKEMSEEEMWNILYYYDERSNFADTVWGKEMMKELIRRENEFAMSLEERVNR
jgi:hypothetical protein